MRTRRPTPVLSRTAEHTTHDPRRTSIRMRTRRPTPVLSRTAEPSHQRPPRAVLNCASQGQREPASLESTAPPIADKHMPRGWPGLSKKQSPRVCCDVSTCAVAQVKVAATAADPVCIFHPYC